MQTTIRQSVDAMTALLTPSIAIHDDNAAPLINDTADTTTWFNLVQSLGYNFNTLSVPGTPGTPRHTVTPDIGYQDIVSLLYFTGYTLFLLSSLFRCG